MKRSTWIWWWARPQLDRSRLHISHPHRPDGESDYRLASLDYKFPIQIDLMASQTTSRPLSTTYFPSTSTWMASQIPARPLSIIYFPSRSTWWRVRLQVDRCRLHYVVNKTESPVSCVLSPVSASHQMKDLRVLYGVLWVFTYFRGVGGQVGRAVGRYGWGWVRY